ncbi:MAG: hypothetical protein ABR936_08260 [Bacteroidota bacterium]|jgi:hypothetical protein
MDTLQGYERVIIPYGKPIPISKTNLQILLNEHESLRAINKKGVIIFQLKKFKGDIREIARIDTRAQRPTLEFALEPSLK